MRKEGRKARRRERRKEKETTRKEQEETTRKERVLVGPNVRSEDTHTTTEPVERKRWIEK